LSTEKVVRYTAEQLEQMAEDYTSFMNRPLPCDVVAALRQAADDAETSARYRHVAVKYLGWLGVKDPEACIEQDINDPEMIGDLDIARQSQEKKA
jgi:hypothetical protein